MCWPPGHLTLPASSLVHTRRRRRDSRRPDRWPSVRPTLPVRDLLRGRGAHLDGPWAHRALLRGLSSPAQLAGRPCGCAGSPGAGPSLPCRGPRAVTLGEHLAGPLHIVRPQPQSLSPESEHTGGPGKLSRLHGA